ncbi:hypothetical protein HDC94_000505 [Leifsonia sp. AK011]|uniref:hypothetical protein n=1 Tax=Leifsonia sp. AK011 TaxID=2723075 RepID=UPI0015C78F44|nr:hypothetical protein [Leifsonia sp. AK011]NYF09349.1 hypothetical protein [Leifsonia sp. AK011]
MITNKRALLALGIVGFFVGAALAYAVSTGTLGLWATQQSQMYDEPARAPFVWAATSLAAIPVLGVAAWGAFRLAHATSPVRRGLTAWGVSILLTPLLLVGGLFLSMSLATPDMANAVYFLLAGHGLLCSLVWVAVARARFETIPEPSPLETGATDES